MHACTQTMTERCWMHLNNCTHTVEQLQCIYSYYYICARWIALHWKCSAHCGITWNFTSLSACVHSTKLHLNCACMHLYLDWRKIITTPFQTCFVPWWHPKAIYHEINGLVMLRNVFYLTATIFNILTYSTHPKKLCVDNAMLHNALNLMEFTYMFRTALALWLKSAIFDTNSANVFIRLEFRIFRYWIFNTVCPTLYSWMFIPDLLFTYRNSFAQNSECVYTIDVIVVFSVKHLVLFQHQILFHKPF